MQESTALALVMMAGWWVLKSSQQDQQNLAVQMPKANTTPKVEMPAVKVKPEVRVDVEAPSQSAKIAQLEKPVQTRQPQAQSEVRQIVAPVVKQEEVKRIESVTNLEAIARREPELKPESPAPAELPQVASQSEKTAEDKTFIVKVVDTELASAEDMPEKPAKKKKLFSRIAKGLKHIQEGEWKEVGLDSKTIIARTEDNIFKKH